MVAYLINIYPAPSHSFIRREIAALESDGWRVHRFAHRRSGITEPDPADQAERLRTEVLRDSSWFGALGSVAKTFARSPFAAGAAAALTFRMAWQGDRRFVAHAGYFGFACILSRRLSALGCRHVHAHMGTNAAAVAMIAGQLHGTTFSLTLHGPHEFVLPDRINLCAKIAVASFVAVVSRAGEAAVRDRYPQHATKLVRVRCGLDAIWFNESSTAVPRAMRLVSVMRLDPQKNPLLLIEAAKHLDERRIRFHLTILGGGSLRPESERRIQELGLAHCVHLVGWGSQDQVRQHLRASRALVLSSDDEGLPVAIMEAFAMGRPAIATDVGGVSELVETGATGWLVPKGDLRALADATAQCLSASAQTLQHLANNARRKVQEFDVRESAKTLGEAFVTAS